ncbi:hypothetical protein FBQ95_16580 [Chloroflexi bacterium CFX3]|nr:hypothetical protein [Chloroflexi bacterium CFX3]
MTVQDFVQRWQSSALQERQAAQSHFNELCRLIGHPPPAEADPQGQFFTFEEGVQRATGGRTRRCLEARTLRLGIQKQGRKPGEGV